MFRNKSMFFRFAISAVVMTVVAMGAVIGFAQFRLRPGGTGESVSMKHNGLDREYRIHVPENLPADAKVPLVVCFHGGGGNARTASIMGLTPVADREGFIVLYPNGIDKHWNDGRESPMFAEHDQSIDDVGFVMDLIKRVCKEHPVDRHRIFATGISNGGFMTQRLAIEHSETFAAVAVVIATMGETLSKQFEPKSPVSILYMNGTEDRLVPYDGGPVAKPLTNRFNQVNGHEEAPRGRAISTDEAVSMWVKHNQTNPDPKVELIPDTNKEDHSHIESRLWEGGERGTTVMLYKVIGGGHGLPGGTQYFPARLIGYPNQDVQGFDLIWDFFQKHARQPKEPTTESPKRNPRASHAESTSVRCP